MSIQTSITVIEAEAEPSGKPGVGLLTDLFGRNAAKHVSENAKSGSRGLWDKNRCIGRHFAQMRRHKFHEEVVVVIDFQVHVESPYPLKPEISIVASTADARET